MPEGVGEGRRGVEFLISLQLTEVFSVWAKLGG